MIAVDPVELVRPTPLGLLCSEEWCEYQADHVALMECCLRWAPLCYVHAVEAMATCCGRLLGAVSCLPCGAVAQLAYIQPRGVAA